MTKIFNFEQEKIDRESPTIFELIEGLTSNNCDKDRPYNCQQPLRAKAEVVGLTLRDIKDCMVLGILECRDSEKYGELPRIYVSETGNKYDDLESLVNAGEDFKDSYIDPRRVTYNNLYGWDLDSVDPVAAVQNMGCHLERRMNCYPNTLDGKLTSDGDSENEQH